MALLALRTLGRVRRDQRGASLIEFGFLAPVLTLMVGGIIDLSQGLAGRFALQQAVNRSLEIVQARPARANANQSQVDYGFLITEAATAAGVNQSQVTLTKWLQCTKPNGTVVKMADYNARCAADEETARYIRLRIVKDFTGQIFLGTVQMSAAGAMRTQ